MGLLEYTFDWTVLWRAPHGRMFLDGILTTLKLSAMAWVIAVAVGILVALLRISRSPRLRFFGFATVQLFRNTPLLVQLFFWYYAAPLLLPGSAQAWLYDNVPDYSFWAGTAALGIYTASRVAEQFRSGLAAIPRDQYQAAYSTGLNTYQTYRHVILPYACRIILPPFTTEFLTYFKNSALTIPSASWKSPIPPTTSTPLPGTDWKPPQGPAWFISPSPSAWHFSCRWSKRRPPSPA